MQVLRDWYQELVAANSPLALDRFADDVEWNMQGQIPFSGRRRGREQVREFFALRDRLYRTDRFDVT
ncbi:MAG TPA: hypothetical protein VN442_09650, partial [Bryobacteraceae bacterium]|nr:hypothetical protein [Bryobacteraceae bacterium]